MKLLITFGCSWTYGVGVNYVNGMSEENFKKNAWNSTICDQYSFRGLIASDRNLHNINFSCAGSSNQTQFRLAETFFSSTNFEKLVDEYDEIVVLWGITSVFRNDIYSNKEKNRKTIFYSDKSLLSKTILTDYFNCDEEIHNIFVKIQFWNKFFKKNNIKNLWFDTFNHHDYHKWLVDTLGNSYKKNAGADWPSWEDFVFNNVTTVKKEILDEILNLNRWDFYQFDQLTDNFFAASERPRDLLSKLAMLNGLEFVDNNYHLSTWKTDSNRIQFLVSKGILNPFSMHPTKLGHQQIANMLLDLF